MASDCLVEWLAIGKATEMEGCAPTVLVKVSGDVVVTVDRVSLDLDIVLNDM